MKLNLLPVTVSRGAKTRSAWILTSLLIAGCAVGCFFIITAGEGELKAANAELGDAQPAAVKALAMSTEADTQIQKASPYLRNTGLAKSMLAHNRAYPDLYAKVFKYIPPFFRINSITATAIGADTAQITMQGTLHSHQQYADLMLALLRPGSDVISVSRSGFVSEDLVVPQLDTTDQVGRAKKPTDPSIPSDPLERLTYFQSQARPDSYTGTGNFGAEGQTLKLNMPGDSLITVQLLVKASLQVPNPTATLSAGAGSATTTTTIPTMPGPSGAPPSGATKTGGAADDRNSD